MKLRAGETLAPAFTSFPGAIFTRDETVVIDIDTIVLL
jgi:hypothetical protein